MRAMKRNGVCYGRPGKMGKNEILFFRGNEPLLRMMLT